MKRDLFDAGTVRPELMPFYPFRPWVAYPSACWHCATSFLSVWLNSRTVGHLSSWEFLWPKWELVDSELELLGPTPLIYSGCGHWVEKCRQGYLGFHLCPGKYIWNFSVSKSNIFLTAHSVPSHGIGKFKLFYDALLTIMLWHKPNLADSATD